MKAGQHLPEETKERFSGSLRFSSRTANSNLSIGRKDELESWLYSLIFLLQGELPWMHIASKTIKDANDEVLLLKNNRKTELLAGLPPPFS
jgi:hypothetical protein